VVSGRHDEGGSSRGGGSSTSTSTSAMESLYPFLYADTSDLAAVLEQVRASTIDKTGEVLELRRTIARRDGARMARCAHEMATRFAAGGRLFAFGNGGSATDAQQLATTAGCVLPQSYWEITPDSERQ
jgi:D-sedoheptulose 7-phosphate isomerase